MFSFKGVNFRDMHLRVVGEVEYNSTVRDKSAVKIPGRHGKIYMDNGRYESVDRGLKTVIDLPRNVNIEDVVTKIHNWLVSEPGEHELTFGEDRNFVYRASVVERQRITRLLRNYGRALIRFRLHPIKYLKTGLEEIPVANGAIINNPYDIDAEPRIIIRGRGSVVITIGDQEIVLKNLDDGLIVDSELETPFSLDGERTHFDKMFSYPFPALRPGDNVFTIPQHVSVSIITRLGALV